MVNRNTILYLFCVNFYFYAFFFHKIHGGMANHVEPTKATDKAVLTGNAYRFMALK